MCISKAIWRCPDGLCSPRTWSRAHVTGCVDRFPAASPRRREEAPAGGSTSWSWETVHFNASILQAFFTQHANLNIVLNGLTSQQISPHSWFSPRSFLNSLCVLNTSTRPHKRAGPHQVQSTIDQTGSIHLPDRNQSAVIPLKNSLVFTALPECLQRLCAWQVPPCVLP